jgi:hypothetical protein
MFRLRHAGPRYLSVKVQLVEEGVLPQHLHVVPVGDHTTAVLEGEPQIQETSPLLGLITHIYALGWTRVTLVQHIRPGYSGHTHYTLTFCPPKPILVEASGFFR